MVHRKLSQQPHRGGPPVVAKSQQRNTRRKVSDITSTQGTFSYLLSGKARGFACSRSRVRFVGAFSNPNSSDFKQTSVAPPVVREAAHATDEVHPSGASFSSRTYPSDLTSYSSPPKANASAVKSTSLMIIHSRHLLRTEYVPPCIYDFQPDPCDRAVRCTRGRGIRCSLPSGVM